VTTGKDAFLHALPKKVGNPPKKNGGSGKKERRGKKRKDEKKRGRKKEARHAVEAQRLGFEKIGMSTTVCLTEEVFCIVLLDTNGTSFSWVLTTEHAPHFSHNDGPRSAQSHDDRDKKKYHVRVTHKE